MEIITIPTSDVYEYGNNPRNNNDAVLAVKESIQQCGYCSPIVVDEQHVILAGHTRYKAVVSLGWDTVQCVIVSGMSAEQKRKFRLLDNKTAELAEWDFEKLKAELTDLDFSNFDFGFVQDRDFDVDDESFITGTEITKSKTKMLVCPHCGKEFEV